jgi:ketosteroid isomerase-like protein
MTDHHEHPARAASQRSRAAVEAGDREGWLALFADDAVVEDPIGPSMFDPDGTGHHGPEGIAAFYDSVIGPNQVRFAIRESYACGSEVANVGTITTTLGDGSQAVVEGVYTYRVDHEGKVVALRAFWEADGITFVPAPD